MSSEAVVQQNTRLTFFNYAPTGQLWRNNNGACQDETGRQIRYGLGNDSAKMNREIKSSDLIGITPEQVYHPARGWIILGALTALEIKPSDWVFPQPTNRAEYARCLAQAKFHDIVRAAGGYAGFVTDPARDIPRIIGRG